MTEKKPVMKNTAVPGEQIKAFKSVMDAFSNPAILANADNDVIFANPLAVNSLGIQIGQRLQSSRSAGNLFIWRNQSDKDLDKIEFNVFRMILDDQPVDLLIFKGDFHDQVSQGSNVELLKNLFEQSRDGIAVSDHDLKLIEWSKGMENLTGYSREEVLGMTVGEIVSKITQNLNDSTIADQFKQKDFTRSLIRMNERAQLTDTEIEIQNKSGQKRIAQYRMFPVSWNDMVFPSVIIRDITEIKTAEDTLRASEIRFRTLVEAMGEGAIALDLDLNIVFSNPVAETIYGAEPGYLVGKSIREFIDKKYEPFIQTQSKRLRQGISNRYEVELVDFRGNTHIIWVTSSPWRGLSQEIRGSILVFSDITDLKIQEDQLRFVSTHDEITQLYNRTYYEEEKKRLTAGRRFPVSVVMMDMDEFKTVNDTLGHSAGDELLKEFGSISRRVFRGEDVVARIGGDEFAVLLPETDRSTARAVVERLQAAVVLHNTENPEMKIYFSVGTGTANSAQELEDAIRRADNRMYRAKKMKKNEDLIWF